VLRKLRDGPLGASVRAPHIRSFAPVFWHAQGRTLETVALGSPSAPDRAFAAVATAMTTGGWVHVACGHLAPLVLEYLGEDVAAAEACTPGWHEQWR